MRIICCLNLKKLFFCVCILMLKLMFFTNCSASTFSHPDLMQEIDVMNISARLSVIPDDTFEALCAQGEFLNLKDISEIDICLNNDIEEELKWDKIAGFRYFLKNSDSSLRNNPFDISEENKNKYGIILANDSDILIVFKGISKEKELIFPEDLSFYDSTRLYNLDLENPKMKYIQHFFNIQDSHSYINQSLFYRLIGILSPTSWVNWYFSPSMHEQVLHAALSCQTEVFRLLDNYTSSIHKISLMGYKTGAGISTVLSCLLYQKFKEEGINLAINILNFETPQIFDGLSIGIFYEKIKKSNFRNILSPDEQNTSKILARILKEGLEGTAV